MASLLTESRGPAVPDTTRRSHGWLLLLLAGGLALRLFEVTAPLTDHQAWRQADTAAIARNYLEEGLTFFHPRVDWRGTTSGHVEMNLPLFPFLVACLYAVGGGAHEWLGRGLAALFSTATAIPLFHLARSWLGSESGARLAVALYLLLPLSVFFGRAFMPEPLMLLLSVATVAAFWNWHDRGLARLMLAAATAGVCFAVKIPTLYLGFPLVAIAVGRWGWRFVLRPDLWLYLGVALVPSVLWYRHAARLFDETGLTFGIWNRHGYDKWDHALLLDPGFYHLMADRFVNVVFTPAGFGLLLIGIVGVWPRRESSRPTPWALIAWLGGLLLYLLLIPEGNRRLHYYQLPLLLPAVVVMAAPLAVLWDRHEAPLSGRLGAWLQRVGPGSLQSRVIVGATVLAVAGGSLWSVREYYRPGNNIYRYYTSCQRAGELLDARMPADAMVVAGDIDLNAGALSRAQSPTMLYYCHRKGWQITSDDFRSSTLDSLARQGADYFVVAAGFVRDDPVFWPQLLERGLTTAATFPQFCTDMACYRQLARSTTGLTRNLLVARLVDMPQRGN